MRRSSGWYAGAVVLALTAVTALPLAAQGTEEEEESGERCVCVDVEEVRAETRVAMEEAREAMRQAREQVREIRFELADRARLGVGIDYDQGARWDSVGVRVTRVPDGGPAGEAGIREGDVILAIDGRSLTDPLPDAEEEDDLDEDRSLPVQRLSRLVRTQEPGDEVEVAYRRDGERMTATVELGSLRDLRGLVAPEAPRAPRAFRFRDGSPPRPPRVHAPRPEFGDELRRELRRGLAPLRWTEACRGLPQGAGGGPCVAGLRVATVNPDLGQYFGTDEGVLVTAVAEGSELGLRAGDVVLGIGGRVVEDAGDLRRILRSYEEDEEVRFRVRRDGSEREVTGTMP